MDLLFPWGFVFPGVWGVVIYGNEQSKLKFYAGLSSVFWTGKQMKTYYRRKEIYEKYMYVSVPMFRGHVEHTTIEYFETDKDFTAFSPWFFFSTQDLSF